MVFGMLGVSVVNTNKVEAKELSGVKSVGINRVDCSTPFSVQVWSNSTTCWINEGAQDVTLYNVSGGSGGHWDTNVGYVTDVPHHFTIPNCMSMQILGTVTAYVVHILRFSTSNC
ncbi:MAG: hypothetical protein LBT99_01265 [Bifidobacteriaceae bacterium]|nr:hypothetical protein [Bifidobacteriaceae bacterium]